MATQINIIPPSILPVQKFKFTTTTHKGIFVRVVYRFRNERTGLPVGIQLGVNDERRVKIYVGQVDKDNRIIKDFEFRSDEIIKFFETQLWCIKDFFRMYPEYKWYKLS